MSVEHAIPRWADFLVGREAKRSRVTKPVARQRVARAAGVSPGTIENVQRGRIKGLRIWVAERLRAAVIRELEHEIMRLEHELHMARQGGSRPGSDEILSAEAALAAARRVLNGA